MTMTTMMRTLLIVTLVACASSKNNPDAGTNNPDGSGLSLDAFGGPSFGDQCTTSAECAAGGYCVDGANSDLCTYGCDQGCPEGWNCRVSDVGGDLVSLCMPQKFDFCKPCTEDIGCNGGVCVLLDGAGYCLPDCPFEGSCPTGYSCNPDPTSEHTGNYCVPDTGSCTCTAAEADQIRTCQTMNSAGTCYGIETCMPDNGGWTGCTATTAGTEICDGMDNDCDQLIDDGVSGSACPKTNQYGTCQGVQLCTGSIVVCQGQTPAAETCNGGDDDCDGTLDETWPTLSMPCTDGVGGCQRFGVYRCNDGVAPEGSNGTECSVTAGPSQNETCNGIDDDCNSSIDEEFKTPIKTVNPLGASCTVGQGACQRTGNFVCNSSGTDTACSIMQGTPVMEQNVACNGVDDDCDGFTDETFKNTPNGIYNQDAHCGSCATDCTAIYNLPNANGVCTVSGTASCSMVCDDGAYNVDGAAANGCELVVDPNAIYVSTNDVNAVDDGTCGQQTIPSIPANHPCKTIAYGITRSQQAPQKSNVRVANGIYDEAVTMANGKNLLGGHAPDNWIRNVAGTGTLITGVATFATTNHDYTVLANAMITTATIFEGFVVIASLNTKQAGNSYAIYVSGSNNLSIINNVIYGGRGGPGSGGGQGNQGPTGVSGAGRDPNSPAAYDAKVTTGTAPCEAAVNNRSYTNGGQRTCGADIVNGGNGGGNQCNPRPAYNMELSGIDGVTGQLGDPTLGGAAGAGADAGDDGILVRSGGSDLCGVPDNFDYGRDGALGRDAAHGAAGAGCSAPGGTVASGHWGGSSGGIGGAGGNGGGGGGGGAGGGGKCAANGEIAGYMACQDGRDRLGGHGGGGGSGGCGGTGGSGATAGGGAFAIFIVGGTAPIVTGNSITRGDGGTGGGGGQGGNGGPGGVGAPGGNSTTFCSGPAGRGGNGGDGGHGGGGGGGCGGGSFAIYSSGVGSPTYCAGGANNTITGGSSGAGGAGGYSLVFTGGAGSAGALAACIP